MSTPTTLRAIYWDSTRPAKLLTAVLYGLVALGFFLARDMHREDLDLIFSEVHWSVWCLATLYLCISRCIGLFVWSGTYETKVGTPVVGVIFWSMLLAASMADHDNFAFGAMYAAAIAIEGWLFSRARTGD